MEFLSLLISLSDAQVVRLCRFLCSILYIGGMLADYLDAIYCQLATFIRQHRFLKLNLASLHIHFQIKVSFLAFKRMLHHILIQRPLSVCFGEQVLPLLIVDLRECF